MGSPLNEKFYISRVTGNMTRFRSPASGFAANTSPLLMKLGDICRITGLSKHLSKKVLAELDIQPVVIASSQFYRTEQVIAGLEKVYAAKEVKENGS